MPHTASPMDVREGRASLLAWLQENAEDNQADLDKMRRNLVRAIREELTPRQQKLLQMHYFERLSKAEIARRVGVHKSTVTRTISRAESKLKHVLSYTV